MADNWQKMCGHKDFDTSEKCDSRVPQRLRRQIDIQWFIIVHSFLLKCCLVTMAFSS